MKSIRVAAQAHHHIIRLEVSVNVVFLVHHFYALQGLVKQHHGGLEAELAPTEVEKVFQAWTH